MLFLWGVIYAIVAGLLADWLFPSSMASMVMVALAAIAVVSAYYAVHLWRSPRGAATDV